MLFESEMKEEGVWLVKIPHEWLHSIIANISLNAEFTKYNWSNEIFAVI